jgi:hypothetical protein
MGAMCSENWEIDTKGGAGGYLPQMIDEAKEGLDIKPLIAGAVVLTCDHIDIIDIALDEYFSDTMGKTSIIEYTGVCSAHLNGKEASKLINGLREGLLFEGVDTTEKVHVPTLTLQAAYDILRHGSSKERTERATRFLQAFTDSYHNEAVTVAGLAKQYEISEKLAHMILKVMD